MINSIVTQKSNKMPYSTITMNISPTAVPDGTRWCTMTLNPITFAEHVNRHVLRYQLTAFPLSYPDLEAQARNIFGATSEESHLVKGLNISLSRSFAKSSLLSDLVK